MFYCITCHRLHLNQPNQNQIIFTTGFHYLNSNLYPAGICKVAEEQHVPCKTVSA